jgi:hypothetical protein
MPTAHKDPALNHDVTRVRKVLDSIDRVKTTDSDYHLVREIRGYVVEAGFALLQVDSPRAVSALDEAIRALENKD